MLLFAGWAMDGVVKVIGALAPALECELGLDEAFFILKRLEVAHADLLVANAEFSDLLLGYISLWHQSLKIALITEAAMASIWAGGS